MKLQDGLKNLYSREMKYRKNIYCEKEFIRMCVEKLETSNASCTPEEWLLLNRVKNIVSDTYTKLYLNMSSDEIDGFSKDIYKRKLNAAKKGKEAELSSYERFMYGLFMKQQNGEVQIKHFDDIDFDNQDEVDLNGYYFTCKDCEQCKIAMKRYGILAVNMDNIKDFSFVLKDNGEAICNNSKNTWQSLLESVGKLPYNSMIIIDNYILNDTDEMVENLQNIFASLLPDRISVPIQITIFSKIRNDKNVDLPSEPRLIKIKELLQKHDSCTIELTIVKCQNFHDRAILTNSMFFGCPGGFNLFKQGKSQKTTYFNATNPFFGGDSVKWATGAYSNYIADASAVFQSSPEYGSNGIDDSFSQFCRGKKENRILDGFKG
jgi:hypothetical protein